MLVKTCLHDSQVMYWEPAKYVAKLRTLKTDDNPLLLVTNMEAGHGGASGRYDYLKEIAFDYAFLLKELGLSEQRAILRRPRPGLGNIEVGCKLPCHPERPQGRGIRELVYWSLLSLQDCYRA